MSRMIHEACGKIFYNGPNDTLAKQRAFLAHLAEECPGPRPREQRVIQVAAQ